MKVWQVVLLRIHEKHPDDDAIEHTDGGHCALLLMNQRQV
jgi:hypothetical protein